MSEGNALVKVGLRDPNRCQSSAGNMACQYRAVPGSHNCPMHGGAPTAAAAQRRELRQLVLSGEIGQQAREMMGRGPLKDLTDEVILVKVILQGLVKNIVNPADYVIYSDKVMSVLKTSQSLVESLQKLQEKNKELVDRATLFTIAEGILAVISVYVTDPDAQRAAGEEIYGIIIKGLGGEVQG